MAKDSISCIEQLSRQCYYVGLAIGFLLLVGVGTITYFKVNIVSVSPFGDCLSKYRFYCFGCGGTRAVDALLKGKFLLSIYYHPFVLYAAVVYLSYMLSHTLNILSRGRIKSMRFRPCYFYIAMVIIIGQCMVKNILLWRYGFVL